ncbi:MAG: hypothetical protein HYS12_07530 [Planctomycetes bacterium]|nr:hypothetical protein [Planctomycetota bacterium]
MRSLLPYMAGLILFVCSPQGRLAASDDETANLKLRVQQLEAEVKALREELARLKGELHNVPGGKSEEARLATDVRLLMHLAKALEKEPKNLDLRLDTAALAKRVAPRRPCRLVWEVLLKTDTLKDGLSLQEAEKLLGPPTDKSDSHVGWYFNPDNRHVAPYLRAKDTKEGLAEWKIVNR